MEGFLGIKGIAKTTAIIGLIIVIIVAGIGGYIATRPPEEPVEKIYVGVLSPGRGDLSFYDMAFKGAEMAAKEFGFEIVDLVVASPADMIPALRMAAKDPYARLIVGADFWWQEPVDEVAPDFPGLNFVIIDAPAKTPRPNVIGVVYEQHKGSALVGALGALLAIHYDKPHIGGVFGHPIPVLWNFEIGYKWGCDWAVSWYENNFPENYAAEPTKSIAKTPRDRRVLYDYILTWDDVVKGETAARAMFDMGAVAVYNISGGAGMGIFSAVEKIAAEKGLTMGPPFGIGVDANQDWMAPGFIIASMLKRVDYSVYEMARLVDEGRFQEAAIALDSVLVLGIGTELLGKPVTGNEVSNLALLDEFIEFGMYAENVLGKRVLPMEPDEIRVKVTAMRAAQPAWVWNAVTELEGKIRRGEVTVPNVWTEAELSEWRAIFG